MTRKLIYAVPFLTAVLFILFLLKHKENDEYYTVEEKFIRKVIYASGVVKPSDYVIVRSEVSGYIKEIFVKENDRVKRGQLLALVDAGPLVYALKETQSKLSLIEDRLNADSEYLKALKEDIQKLDIKLQQEKVNLERRENLYQRGLIAKELYENAKTSYEITQKEYEKALAVYQDTVNSLKREREILIHQRNRIEKELERYYIRSPIDGVVLKKYVNVGDYVNALSQDNKLFSIGNSSSWEVILEVDEEFLGLIKEGMKAYVTLDAYPNETFEGKVLEIIRDVDKGKRVFQVKLQVELPQHTPANATAEANIVVYERKAPVIPKQVYKDGKVLVFDGVRLKEVEVKTGQEIEGFLEVLEGLKVGDKVKLR